LVEADESATDSVNLWSGPGNGAGPFLWQSTPAASWARLEKPLAHEDGPRHARPVDFGSASDETLIMEVLLDIRGMTVDILRILEDDDEEEEDEQEDS